MTKNWYAEISHSQNYALLERLLFRVAKKWISGYTYKDAISAAKGTNNKRMSAILNFLGEESIDVKQIEQTVNEYCSLLDFLKSNEIDGCISVKPTQIGLKISYEMCLYNFKQIANKAKSLGKFIWIDIESFQFVENTIAIYLELFKEYKQTGLAIQAYLKRSSSDLLHLLEEGANVRVVKGAYRESENNAFQSADKINLNFSKLMQMLFENSNDNAIFAIATHDSKLIEEAIELSEKYENIKKRFEFQLLMGICDQIKMNLVERKFRVSEYIPYGSHWLPYSVRRIRERKRNILLLARSLVQS
ncbi:MAG TPA: proline dehydrogenase family protein [Nitrososphaeraceae archaeon]|nr:proline dehydrogenase family protein [Nitrososphaeraceae archaeon]